MNYTTATYSNINPALFYGGGFCGGVDPRREQYAGEDVAGVEVPNYKTKYEALQNVIKDNYQLFEVDYYGVDNDNYVDGEGFCCEPKAQAKNARSLPTENVDYEKLQYYYHSDHLGSASYITNLDGEVVQHIEYVPFGEVFLEERNNTWNTPFLFNGKELDEETGLYYYGARYYNPRISLWYGVDPLAEKYPVMSPYAYCFNHPINYRDPDGKLPMWATGLIGSGVSVAIGYISAKINNEEYTWADAGKDALVGFAVGSGAALLAPALGVTATSSLGAKVAFGAGYGMTSSMAVNAGHQFHDMLTEREAEWDNTSFMLSGAIGLFTGATVSVLGHGAQKFMNKVGGKMFKDFTKRELSRYERIQTKYLKRQIEAATGGKVGKRQLEREVNKKVKEWSSLKAMEIEFIEVSTTEAVQAGGNVSVTIGSTKVAKKLAE